ncbi:phenylalanine--tRNA ligase subunit beta [Tuwongella immobilis]|uniref:Phenylalanine--tRNA ligase beta subunit n=1 Tax=Tuwongella immobilis TaxID=692036 RepID=A0A6C2YH10_9BACT|nr:phenylalanine--tRNA ligase subunit beta [Tuwongella immobilis]VIP00644.1 phenylalanyl-trna synthetase subunit beta : Phenylalanine--tRNA ligase beta subunit OS=Anaerolinea thermophila (strain DSM 14523 / JCM 11388 / NBRC 100420 / UNI-1) GN=pheT PE=3 SV=1: tRNA_bind: B3_4: B5: FDX-ACB [Tuwongella immobilis]VTR96706.1 phenylalanyl-trna synthetase subunit beta : Phenylalanine--tRNA ligase beta subunit OS=Anaerolinea thermophila (strain DSM 14523 / JCM 11388 / NBRC 100420 / UNI-1) GN=pheT PE=3 SV=
MNVPLRWLRDYVPVEMPVAELIERLTLAGLEVSGFRLYGLPCPPGLKVKPEDISPVWDRDKIVTAQVLEVTKHPNADKLKLVKLEYGAAEPKVVVTGAPNIAVGDVGQKVILGLTGSVLFDGHATPKKLSELKPTMLRGVPSDSMVCSAFELGIHEDHDGIIILDADAPVGVPLQDYIGDIVISPDVLPNMARCLSMLGIAREVAALTSQTVTVPATPITAVGAPVSEAVRVEIDNPALCARYTARLIRNCTIRPAPELMRYRLQYAGMRPIKNLVDITNFVMLETGQPLHAFDYDVLVKRAGGQVPTIIVRAAKAGEKLVTLDEVERELKPDMLVIADTAGPIALAGIKGGLETQVTDDSKNILLESANFDFVSIRRTMKSLNLISDASTRFSKGIHPALVVQASDRACALMQTYGDGQVAPGIVDVYPAQPPVQVIDFPRAEIARVLGFAIDDAEVERVLTALEFQLESTATGWKVTVPQNRLDIQAGAADLIEELARISGYDRLPMTRLSAELPPQKGNPALEGEERVRDLLADAGLDEVIHYALTTPEYEALLGVTVGPYVELLNPLSAERRVMRQLLLPSLFEGLVRNLKHQDRVCLYEIGQVYHAVANEKLPAEKRRVAIALCGRRSVSAWDDPLGQKPAALDFFDLKGVIETLLHELHIPAATFRANREIAYLHPGRAAELVVAGTVIGTLGELHPTTAKRYDLTDRQVLVAELDLDALLAAVPVRYAYQPVPTFPAALRDMAVVVSESVTAEQVEAELRQAGGALLRDVRLFDVYQGSSIADGKKSLAYALTYQASDRTLSDKELDKTHQAIEAHLRKSLNASIRGKD